MQENNGVSVGWMGTIEVELGSDVSVVKQKQMR